MPLKDRLAQALAYRRSIASAGERVSQAAIAAACRISKPSVSDWFSGKTASIEGANLINAANYLKVRPEWLAQGVGRMELGDLREADPASTQLEPPSITTANVMWSLSPEEVDLVMALRAQKAATKRIKELTAIPDADTQVQGQEADNVAALPARPPSDGGGLRLTAPQKAQQRGLPAKKTSHE